MPEQRAMTPQEQKMQLLLELRRAGILDTAILQAIEKTPRPLFVPEAFRAHAWTNTALPIGAGQTISQPLVTAVMTRALDVDKSMKVLEIGTGSGYQAAILSHLCRRVYTVERQPGLLRQAETRFAALHRYNISARLADGGFGWPEQAPFARIMVTAAADDIPPLLMEQLDQGGILVAPVGDAGGPQDLLKVVRTHRGRTVENLGPVHFVPLLAGRATE